MAVTLSSVPYSNREAEILVLVLHAFDNEPTDMDSIGTAVKSLLPASHVVIPRLPLRRTKRVNPLDVVRGLLDLIENQIIFRKEKDWPEFDEIILIGHSMGALLARKVYLLAGPESAEARFEGRLDRPLAMERLWFRKVTRIILFAGMNRGWTLNHHLHFFRFIAWWVLSFAADMFVAIFGDERPFSIMHIRKGAPFLIELRLQWLALQRKNRELQQQALNCGMACPGLALTIQMLGTIDDKVAPADNVDLSTGRDFVYLDVPASSHENVIEMDGSPEGSARQKVFARALCESASTLQSRRILPSDDITSRANETVTDVVFVMHGIRDTGYWTQKVARKVEEIGGNPPKIYASETSSYGYFAMISFLLPSERRKKVRWLMDQYVEARSLYPNARFAYVGHSNGTYLVAKALLDYPSCSFDRIVFAGSVVRTDYDWGQHIARGRVEAVLNYVATADVIVAVLPGAWEIMNLQDLGSAGHNGFRIPHEKVFQTKFVRGGHSCAREEDNWNDIAAFIISPNPGPTRSDLVVQQQSAVVVAMGRTAPLWWLGILAVLCGLGWLVFSAGRHFQHPAIALLIYFWLIWQIVSKL
jgi:alpha-beta hydrolase superfamily lysophospholipase